MKKVFVFSLLLNLAFFASAQKYGDSTWVIGIGHIGKVVTNMNEQNLKSIFSADQIKKETNRGGENESSKIIITLKNDTKTSMELETMCIDICIISRIYLYSDKYQTVKGIGIGSTFSEIRKNYTITDVKGGEKGFMIFVDELPQTAFIVNVPKLKAVEDKTYKDSDIPDDSKVVSVYMY
jgi:hypothetical protein